MDTVTAKVLPHQKEHEVMDEGIDLILRRRIPGFPVSDCFNHKLTFWRKYDCFVKKYNRLTNGMSESKIQLLDQVLKNYCELNSQ